MIQSIASKSYLATMKSVDVATLKGVDHLSMKREAGLRDMAILTGPQIHWVNDISTSTDERYANLHGLAFAVLYKRFKHLTSMESR